MGLFAMMRAWLITALLALLGAESALAASKGTLVIRSPQKECHGNRQWIGRREDATQGDEATTR